MPSLPLPLPPPPSLLPPSPSLSCLAVPRLYASELKTQHSQSAVAQLSGAAKLRSGVECLQLRFTLDDGARAFVARCLDGLGQGFLSRSSFEKRV